MNYFLIIILFSSFVIMGQCKSQQSLNLQLNMILYPKWNLKYSVYMTDNLGNNLGIIGNGIKFLGICDAILYTGSAT